MTTRVWRSWRTWCAAILALAALALTLFCGLASARWIGTPFPGFFVLANRVIASVSLPHWPVAHHEPIYQHAVVAVNGQPVTTSQALYATIRQSPPGSAFTYTLDQAGNISQVTFPSLPLTGKDYGLIFIAYLFLGLVTALIGIGVWFLQPSSAAAQAQLFTNLSIGLFALSGTDLYLTQWFFRAHVMGEAFISAGVIHMTLVFPVDRLGRHRRLFILLPYIAALILSVAYQLALYQPTVYSLIHHLCEGWIGVAGVVFLGKIVWDYFTTDSYLIRQKIRVVFFGGLAGYAFPAAVLIYSGISGGEVPVNYMAFAAFLFPLSVGYAIVKHNLFDIDTLLKRVAYYLALTAILTLVYIAFLTVLNLTLHSTDLARTQLFPLFFTLGVVFLLNPLRNHLQRAVDRVFFRLHYDPVKVQAAVSASLAVTLRLDEIIHLIWSTINATLGVKQGSILLLAPDEKRYVSSYSETGQTSYIDADHPLIRAMQQGQALSRHEVQYGAWPPSLTPLDAQFLIPLMFKEELIGLIILGNKESGTFFSADDLNFLNTLAHQSALSIANALSYQALQVLNANLEQKVDERTRELAHANTELNASLTELEQAYHDLQRSHEYLLQAERMAALGRLTANIAHEINTPLGASLTSLKLIKDLVEEYQTSIGDAGVSAQDHHDIAAEMDQLVYVTSQWLEKAATYIRSLKVHNSDFGQAKDVSFPVLEVIEDVQLLLAHRLRLSQCHLKLTCTSTAPFLRGDPGRLSQVMTNLIVNAIDAYQESGRAGGEIRVEVQDTGNRVEIRVSDQGSGIAAEHLEQIFEPFFSTKSSGAGTGLGLPIVRDIVTNVFGGAMRVESILGEGSVFVVRLPKAPQCTSTKGVP
ncbi:GAF domain-containing sensor histidine kinase [Candidatus Entotheonella palauensis]|uniref:GAF domain-containing sensor histidine kinase n=1 Tax=Candidatus Entotheonella palauensis TaxID=93172 RepID=UPI000B7E1140|nr:ATP-binding protein [Candidatus Entotheonella palauensis]